MTVLTGREVRGLRQSAGEVTLRLAGGGTIRAAYAVGCDGAGSMVREALGVPFEGRTAGAPWVVVDAETDRPLRRLPYFSYVCDPARPSVSMPVPGGHRWEWMVLPGEDPGSVAAEGSVRALLAADVDPDEVRVIRRAIYAFHARTAARWRTGRVLLAGDAAHCMPPFAGQGFGAGVRDAAALAWRLDEVIRGVCRTDLLDGYERERRPHAASMTRLALLAGRVLQPTSPAGAAAARALLVSLDRTPVVGRAFRSGRARPAPRVPRAGLPAAARIRRAGAVLPNPRVRTLAGQVLRLDAVLGDRWAVLAGGRYPGVPGALLRGRSAARLAVVPPGGLRAVAEVPCEVVEDLDGTLLRLLATRGRVALARPDRFLVGVDAPERLGAALAALGALPEGDRTGEGAI